MTTIVAPTRTRPIAPIWPVRPPHVPQPRWDWCLTLEAIIAYLERLPDNLYAGVCGNTNRCVVALALAHICGFSQDNPGVADVCEEQTALTWYPVPPSRVRSSATRRAETTLMLRHSHALSAFIEAFDSLGPYNTIQCVSQALQTARAIAVKRNGYEGVR